MTTTAMFVEIVVVGMQVLATLTVFAACFWGLPSQELLSVAARNSAMTIVLTSPWVYLAGIVGDRLADMVGKRFLEPLFLAAAGTTESVHMKHSAKVLMTASEYQNSLAYFRMRLRILRSAIFHVPLTTSGAVLLLWLQTGTIRWGILSASAICSAAVWFAYRHMSIEYIVRIQLFYRALTKKSANFV